MKLTLTDEQIGELQSLATAHLWMNTIVEDDTALVDALLDRKSEWAEAIVAATFNADNALPDETRWNLEYQVQQAIEGEYYWQYALAMHVKARRELSDKAVDPPEGADCPESDQ